MEGLLTGHDKSNNNNNNNNNKHRHHDDDGGNKHDDGDDDSINNNYPMLELIGHSRAVYGVSQFNYNAHLNSYSSSSSSQHHHRQHNHHNNNDNGDNISDDDDNYNSYDDDDRLILSCSADETIRLWDTAVSQCVGRYNCVCPSWDVAFNPLGYYFASANQDKTSTMYATDRITPIRMFVGHYSDVNCVSWHPHGMLLGTGMKIIDIILVLPPLITMRMMIYVTSAINSCRSIITITITIDYRHRYHRINYLDHHFIDNITIVVTTTNNTTKTSSSSSSSS